MIAVIFPQEHCLRQVFGIAFIVNVFRIERVSRSSTRYRLPVEKSDADDVSGQTRFDVMS